MDFKSFTDDARIWIYGFDRTLSEHEKIIADELLNKFVRDWKSHGSPVRAQYALTCNRFAILAVSAEDVISGCSIDSSIKIFKDLKEKLGVNALDVNLVFYRTGQEIRSTNRLEFQNMIDRGAIGQETMVFDTTIQTLGDLRSGKFERPLSTSWHARVFSLSA